MGAGFFTSSNDAKHGPDYWFNKFCREHRVSQQRSRDNTQQAFFAYVNKERSRFFDSNKELYLDVLLRDERAQDHGCIDFAQDGLIAKLHVINPESENHTLKRERARKNLKLKVAKRFIEDYCKVPVRAIRIDGMYTGTTWTAEIVEVSGKYQRNL